jgi:hypothetical protein
MNKIKNTMLALFLLILVCWVSSCSKHEIPVPGEVTSGAKVAFVQASEKSKSIAFYTNGEKISSLGALAAGVYGGANTAGTRFPVSDYCIFPAGSNDFSTYILGKVQVDSVLTSSLKGYNIEEGKTYTYYYYDNPDGTQTSKIIEDDLPEMDNSKASVRFVNLVSNASNNIKLIVTETTELPKPTLPLTLFSDQAFESASSSAHVFNFPGTTNSYTLTFQVWYTGAPNKLLISKTKEVVQRGRVYTVVAYGSASGTVGFLKFINQAY